MFLLVKCVVQLVPCSLTEEKKAINVSPQWIFYSTAPLRMSVTYLVNVQAINLYFIPSLLLILNLNKSVAVS